MKTAIANSSWLRSQAVAITATSVDFLVTIVLKEFFGFLLSLSTGTGAFCGAVTSFVLLRKWAFQLNDNKWHWQAVRYVLASALSILLNTGGVLLLTHVFGIQYIVSKTLVAILMGLTVNYFMFKYFVFR